MMNYLDDLKANFRSWEYDCDNINDANNLWAVLMQRHPNVDPKMLQSAAYHWVGYPLESES